MEKCWAGVVEGNSWVTARISKNTAYAHVGQVDDFQLSIAETEPGLTWSGSRITIGSAVSGLVKWEFHDAGQRPPSVDNGGTGMSQIPDPNFQDGTAGWHSNNIPAAVTLSVLKDLALARTVIYDIPDQPRASFLCARTSQSGASISWDGPSSSASCTVMAWIRTRKAPIEVSGQLALWDLAASKHVVVNFTANDAWTPITVMGRSSAHPRVEFYLFTVNEDLLIDSVNIF